MKKFLLFIIDLIYRKKCYFCSKSQENTVMCSKCYDKVDFLPYLTERTILGKNIYCACTYQDVVQKLIRAVKYHKKKELAYFQAKIMFDYWKNLNINKNFTVVPVPLSKERVKERKYNHMELVAIEFCKMTGFELNTNLIYRVKNTKPQYKLTRQERLKNLENAFFINPENYNSTPLLLMDDICTTGATFESIIKELLKNNISDVTCFATSTPR